MSDRPSEASGLPGGNGAESSSITAIPNLPVYISEGVADGRQASSRSGSWAGTAVPHGRTTSSPGRPSFQSIAEGLLTNSQGSSFREEARLDATPMGVALAPANLPPSSMASMRSEDSSDHSPGECQRASEAQCISAVSAVSLPGSPEDPPACRSGKPPDIRRWEPGKQSQSSEWSSSRHQSIDLLQAIPESTDYKYEEEEIDRLSRSPEYFSERGKDPGFTMLHFVAMMGHKTLAEALEEGLQTDLTSRNHFFSRLARCLISRHKADVFVMDKYGCTPLQLAAACGNTEMVKVLLEPYDLDASGREVLQQNYHGYEYINHQDSQICFSALHGAVNHNAFDAVIVLLKHGANPQALDVTRKTAFEVAPSLASLQELLQRAVQREDEVPRSVIVQLMAVVLNEQLKTGGTQNATGAAGAGKGAEGAGGSGAAAGSAAADAPGGGGGGVGGNGGAFQDVKGQRSFQAQQRWSKAMRFATSTTQAPNMLAQRLTRAVLETIGNMHSTDVGSTIKRYFGRLYDQKRYDVLVDYVILAINSNQYKLTEIMIDQLCNDCPDVLANAKWHETLEPLVSTYPTLFHRLLFKLQDMRDQDVRGFVQCLSPSLLQTSADQRPRSTPTPLAGFSQRGITKHAVDRVKLLIYQQLVEGLKKVSYRVVKTFFEESDQRLLNDMAQFPIFAEFVSLVANLQTAKAIGESDGVRQALLELLRPPKVLAGATAVVAAAAFSNVIADGRYLGTCAAGPRSRESGGSGGSGAPARPLDAPPVTMAWDNSDSRRTIVKGASAKVSFALNAHNDSPNNFKAACWGPASGEVSGSTGQISSVMRAGSSGTLSAAGASSGELSSDGDGVGNSARRSRGGAGPVTEAHACAKGGDCSVVGADDELGKRRLIRLSLQTLNVQPVLWAAVKAGKAYNVEIAVMSIVSWVDTNSRDGKAAFVAGITADLIQELAMRFPSACATLLNLVSKDVMEQLDTLQVSANMLYGRDHLVKCSHVRNHFTWREQELRKLMMHNKGYSEYVVDALVDYGVPFECVYKAAVEMGGTPDECATPGQFAVLIEQGFTGPELKQLISNGIRLAKVIGYIEECAKPPPDGAGSDFASQLDVPMAVLLRDMLKERLSPRIVDIILREEKMFETTKYNNFRPGRPLRKTFPEKLFVPKYTHHFVQMLLIMWQRGAKNAQGKVTMAPWSKEFIDTVFELNDPLSTKLKSAYDNKLTDTQVYIQGDNAGVNSLEPVSSVWLRDQQQGRQEAADEERIKLLYIRQLLRIFIGNYMLIHRWPVYLAAHVWVFVQGAVHTYWQRLEDFYYREKARRFGLQMSLAKKSRSGTIDAAVLAFPILGLVQPDGGDILTALVHADAPSSWFHFAIVRALYGLHWSNFGRVMVYLSAAVQLQFAAVFLTFFLLVLNYPPLASGSTEELNNMNRMPVIQGTLCVAMVLSGSMILERLQEARVPQSGSWVSFGRHLELCCHAMVWTVTAIVWAGKFTDLVPALSGLTMLLFVARLTLFGLITEKLSTAVLALLEILSDSRYFFLLIALVYGGFALAVAGLRQQTDHNTAIYTTQLFTVLLGDFQSSQLTSERDVWRFPDFSLVLLSIYAMLMLIVFMNLLIATMNDTYDRVKEFREVEVMRLRSHMMVFVKDFIKHNARKKLEHLTGDVLHLLLRPEEVKSGRWLSQSAAEPSEYSAWAGRITYMRSTIVREVEAVVRVQADKTSEQLAAIDQRLDKMEASAAAASTAAAAAAAAAPPAKQGEHMAALERRIEEMQRGLEALLSRPSAAI
ncbi:hypothetical protein Vafri_6446 [Volvox africanus]|uniref:Ion transport domain-containing protein n=1 Tax=Volvox africanus TaxID=51714 RepID=A0A8J4EW17_9CHLO|nr:hypothetical protein Vafri_6446 [Volvox africanus]